MTTKIYKFSVQVNGVVIPCVLELQTMPSTLTIVRPVGSPREFRLS